MAKKIKNKKKEYIKQQIISSAKEIIVNEGFDALSIRSIAKAVGYSPGSIYQYYGSKDSIVEELLTDGYKDIIQAVLKNPKKECSVKDLIGFKFRNYALAALKNPMVYKKIMLSSAPNILSYTSILKKESESKAIKLLATSIQKGVDNGEFKKVDTLLSAKILWSNIFGVLIRLIVEKIDDKDEVLKYIQSSMDLFFEGIIR